MPDARINVASSVPRGKPFEVRIIVRHAMETGYRTDESGKSIPRNVIKTFTCRYNGDVVFSARLSSGIAANRTCPVELPTSTCPLAAHAASPSLPKSASRGSRCSVARSQMHGGASAAPSRR